MDSAKKIHATLGVFVLRLFPTMIQMILKDNITPGKLHRMFINKTLNTVLTDADIDLMKMLPNMDNFTIDICYKILRFENLIDEPKCKWGNSPHDTDVEISDDIQRILNFSNEIVSKSSEEITKIFPTTFEENVKRIIERVDGYLKGDNCQQLYKNLHIQHIDTSELLNILEHLLQKHPITVIPSILKTDGKTMMRELYSRIAIVITDIFPDILRELILSRITPQNLYKSFDNAFLSSCYLKQQTDLKTSNLTNSFSCLDIPLIYKLLRYFSLIASPSKGWGKDPHPTDLLIADDVERIRMFRNEIAHRCDANINKNDFDAYFVTFSEIGERIDNHLTGQNSYKQNVIYCKTCVMDTQMQSKYENAAKELENLKLHYERKPVKFYWGDSFEQSLMDLRMMIQNKELEGDEKFRVQIIMQIESDTNNRTVNILNSLRDEINRGLKGIDFVFAFTGSVVLCVDILVEEMETDEKLHLLLFSFMKKIIQTEGIRVPSTEYVNVVLTHSEENTLFEMAKKKTNTSSVVYLDFDIDACHFETDKKMEEALSDIVENVYMKSNGSEIKGDIKATVLPLEFDSNTDIIISEHKEVGKSIQQNINTRGDPENSEVHVKYEKEEQEHIRAAQVAQVLLGKGIQDDVDMESESEDEVLNLVDSDESDEEIRNLQQHLRQIKRFKNKDHMGSDMKEDEDEEAGLPDSKAWGIKKSKYYGGDVEDEDLDLSGSEDEEAAAVMEEKEVLALQKKMAAELHEQGFDLDIGRCGLTFKASSFNKMVDFVGRNPGESLESFIDRVVNPDSSYVSQTKSVIHTVAELMKSKSVDHKIGSTVKGGSLGKGTAVRGRSDADLLFVYTDIPSIEILKSKLPELLKELQSVLARSPHTIKSVKRTPFMIQFDIEVKGQLNEVDLLPIIQLDTGDRSRAKMNPIYQQMRAREDMREYYFKCLAPLQVDFVSREDEKIKRSIRLLKYWIKTRQHVLKSYAAELLVIKAYEEMGKPPTGKMKTLDLMKAVFTKLSDLKNLKVSWDKYYTPSSFYLPSPPYILDPAFPYHNLTRQKSGIDEKYVHLERDAKKFLANLK